jgi:hypothetical protein
MREYKVIFNVICAGPGNPNLARVEELLDLSMKDLVMDDEFVNALDEKQAVTIQIIRADFGDPNG